MGEDRPLHRGAEPSRGTRRLTFRSTGGNVSLVSQERLDMVCPPFVGEQPEAGRHGGFWVELRDEDNSVRFFRVLQDPLRASVEIHSPDGRIRREFGPAGDTTFEVLVPDDPGATTLVLMGEPPEPRGAEAGREARTSTGPREIARFDLSDDDDTAESGRGPA